MDTGLNTGQAAKPGYVSTGHLPAPEQVRALVDEAYETYKSVADGKNSEVYPALARVPSDLFGSAWSGPAATSTRSATPSTSSRS
jgi:glutaminase